MGVAKHFEARVTNLPPKTFNPRDETLSSMYMYVPEYIVDVHVSRSNKRIYRASHVLEGVHTKWGINLANTHIEKA